VRPLTRALGPIVPVLAVTLLAALVACGGSGTGTSPATQASPPTKTAPPLHLVAIGDSIPYNSPDDCPGCAGFVDRYAKALQAASSQQVTVENLSQHNGLTLPMLLDELENFKAQLAAADVIIIGIAHNSTELNQDKPCGGSLDADDIPDWSKMDRACAVASAAKYRPQYEKLFSTVAGWRQGKPTLLRTINRYNDWVGAPGITLTKAEADKTRLFIDLWNSMLCATATGSGFECADIYHRFNGRRGEKPSGDLLAGDYTHPSDKGNEAIAETLVSQGFAPLG
jgi:lysophospholipase L1-like esterase